MSRVPEEEYDRLCAKLSLISVCHEHYHLLELLPAYDTFPFTFIFRNGRVNPEFIQKLANTPVRWKKLTMKISRALLEWASRKEIDRIRIDFYSTVETAVYGRFIDVLLASPEKSST